MPEARYPSLAGRHVLVTGGGTGIGAGLVEAFAVQGARVTFIDVADSESEALSRVAGARYVSCDLIDLPALDSALAAIGPVDVLINNAARDDRHQLADITPEFFERSLAVNLRHFVFVAKAVAPAMSAAGRGVIINMGSISWHLGISDLPLYEAAKAGIEGLTRALARSLGPSGVRVVCIVPGNVQTPRQQQWYTPEAEAEIVKAQCLPVRVQPSDVAALALFLASDDARCCTGHNYWVDAGWR